MRTKTMNPNKTSSLNPRAAIAIGVGAIAMLGAIAAAHAQTQNPVPPPVSVPKALFFQAKPAARSEFMSQLPARPAGVPQATVQSPATVPSPPPFGGTWQVVTNVPTGGPGLGNPLLLTDGTVMIHDANAPDWWKLTPDITGSYVNGTWTQLASLPVIDGTQYAPLYHASAVLPDGRVIIMGGEYNGSGTEVWTNLGAIYNPFLNSWTAVPPPSGGTGGWAKIGDAQSIVLPSGTFLLGSCCGYPDVDALFDASTLGWTATGAPNGDTYQDEQGYTLLPTGDVMTIDVWDPPNAEQYNPSTGIWTYIAPTPVSLIDPVACGNYEIGPAVTRPGGTVVAFGGNTGCTGSADPTAIYKVSTNTWTQGPNVPAISGQNYTLADAPAALLPNGNILFAASPGYGKSPTHFFEFTSAYSASANHIYQVADDVYFASSSSSYYYNFLVLPNGQILATDFSPYVEIYTPTGSPLPSWAPTITSVASCVVPGSSYILSGTQLNGLSQGAAYGDDVQGATNYPLVSIVNNATGHVFYARTSGFTTMSIASGQAGSTNFQVAAGTPLGAGTLYVTANGIPSAGAAVTVSSTCPTVAARR
jgi:hypothetical protein